MFKPEQQRIEEAAADVLVNMNAYRLPVNPKQITGDEEILLAPGKYGNCFDARIEYRRLLNKFIIFYADDSTGRSEGRINFSLGHELAHFYLDEHRGYLLSGIWHGSHAGFVSDNKLEREADWFSAALLMPAELFRREVSRFRQSVCTLRDLRILSERLQVSLTSTAIRYCQCDVEASSVLLSRSGRVLYHVASSDMSRLGCGFLKQGMLIPLQSKTSQLLGDENIGSEIFEGKVYSGIWYESRWGDLWEEAMRLGNSGLVLTYLVHESK
jgi:IrrE N-terminal-like domain